MKYDENILILNALRNYQKTLDRQAQRYEHHPDIGPIFRDEYQDIEELINIYRKRLLPTKHNK